MSSAILVGLRRLVAAVAVLACGATAAQGGAPYFSKEQIDQLTAQVALFPDALLAQVLMAATYPSDVAAAAAWSRANPNEKGDAAVELVDEKPWDPSVQSLVAFPQVIVTMGEDPTWVKDLGDAFLLQPEDVMDSVQRLRAVAQKAGSLKSNEQISVTVESQPPPTIHVEVTAPPPPPQVIVIEQRSPEVIFVPMFNPVHVFVPWMWPAFPPMFIPPPLGFWWSWPSPVAVGIWWGAGIGIRHAVWGHPNWWNRSVTINVHHHNSIHVRNRIDRRDRDVRWAHDTNRRRDVPYRGGDATRQRLQDRAARIDREQYRGRDVDRQRAQQALLDRGVATDRAALRDIDRERLQQQLPGASRDRPQGIDRDAARDRAQAIDRGAARDRAQEIPRGGASDRAQAVDRDAVRDRAQAIDRDAARERAQAVDRSAAIDRARDAQRNPTLQGINDRQARQQVERGNASRQSMQQQLQSRPQAQRPADAGGARPQVPRPPNTGAARPQAPSGGGGAAARAQQRPQGGGRPSR